MAQEAIVAYRSKQRRRFFRAQLLDVAIIVWKRVTS